MNFNVLFFKRRTTTSDQSVWEIRIYFRWLKWFSMRKLWSAFLLKLKFLKTWLLVTRLKYLLRIPFCEFWLRLLCHTVEGDFWHFGKLLNGKPSCQYCRDCSNILEIFLETLDFSYRPLMFYSCWDQFSEFRLMSVCLAQGRTFW